MHIEYIVESAVSEPMLLILKVTVSSTSRGRIGRMWFLTVITPTEIAFSKDSTLLKHVNHILIRQPHQKKGERSDGQPK
jgi:hypothetical protein